MKHIHLSNLMPITAYMVDAQRLIQGYVYAYTPLSVKESTYAARIVVLVVAHHHTGDIGMFTELNQTRILFSEYLANEQTMFI